MPRIPVSMSPVKPRVIPAAVKKTFDKVRIANLRLNALQPNRPAKLRAELVYCREVDGSCEPEHFPICTIEDESTAKDHTSRVGFVIDNLFETAQFVPTQIDPVLSAIATASPEEAVGIAVAAMQAAVEKYAKAKKVI